MYEIYINESKLILANTQKLSGIIKSDNVSLIVRYNGEAQSLLKFIDKLERSKKYNEIIIHSDNYKQLKLDFKSLYQTIKAGGGLILNEFDEILFIHRRGFWDLPKGKLDKGETSRDGAIREVMEETGIQNVRIVSKIFESNHTFKARQGRRLIKKVKWYLMRTNKQVLVPQLEEDINKAVWMTIDMFNSKDRKVYYSIKDVLNSQFIGS